MNSQWALTRDRLAQLDGNWCRKTFDHSHKYVVKYQEIDEAALLDAEEEKYEEPPMEEPIINENYEDESDPE